MNKVFKKAATITMAIAIMAISSSPAMAASNKTYTDSTSGGNAVLVSGTTKTINKATITKTGSSSSGDADFYGTNAAVLAKNKGTLTLKNSTVTSNGTHANGVFAYGSGTTVKVSNTKITTKGNNSGGIMTTGGATMIAKDLTVKTSGNSSAAIRSDRGGGTVKVTGGTYSTSGVGSPAIYSTAKIAVTDATLKSTRSEAVVIEGGNSVTLKNCDVTGNNSKLNGQSEVKTNVMIYQSMSGDASSGTAKFSMTGGTLTAKTGCMFYVTNTTAKINLNNVTLKRNTNYCLMRIQQGPWGTSGSNGGNVTFTAKNQKLKGKIIVDSKSSLALSLKSGSTYIGAIKSKGTVNVTIADGCTWKLTGNSTISSLDCDADAIDLNGYTLTVNGKTWTN